MLFISARLKLKSLTKVRAGGVSCCAPCHRRSIVCATIVHSLIGFYHVVHLSVFFASEHAPELGHGCCLTTITSVLEQELP